MCKWFYEPNFSNSSCLPYAPENLRLLLFVLSTWISCILFYRLDRNLSSYTCADNAMHHFFFSLLVSVTKFACFDQYLFWTRILDLLQIYWECNFADSILGREPIEHRVAHWVTDMHVNPTGRKQCVNKRGLYQLLFSAWEPLSGKQVYQICSCSSSFMNSWA